MLSNPTTPLSLSCRIVGDEPKAAWPKQVQVQRARKRMDEVLRKAVSKAPAEPQASKFLHLRYRLAPSECVADSNGSLQAVQFKRTRLVERCSANR